MQLRSEQRATVTCVADQRAARAQGDRQECFNTPTVTMKTGSRDRHEYFVVGVVVNIVDVGRDVTKVHL